MGEEINPKWVAFLKERGLVHAEAEKLERQGRISLNADFMCWNMARMVKEGRW